MFFFYYYLSSQIDKFYFYSKSNNDRQTVCSDRRKYTFMKIDEFAMGGEEKKEKKNTFQPSINHQIVINIGGESFTV